MKELSKVLKPGDRHLTEDELDRLTATSGLNDPAQPQANKPEEDAVRHLSECPNCRIRLDQRIAANSKLALLKAPASASRGDDCPGDEEWMNMAAGIANEQVSRKMLDHAAYCDHCGPLFHDMVERFSDSTLPEETQMVASLSSNSPAWQSRMAARLSPSSGTPTPKVPLRLGYWSWKWPVFGCATAAAAVLIWIFLPRPEQRLQKLIVEAYSERRTIELRIPGASYATLRITRGSQASNMDRPASLLEAEGLIGRGLAKHPANANFLQAKVRADLLDGNFDSAVHTAEFALEQEPESASLLSDLGSAYFQRAERDRTAIDYGKAYEYMSKSLAKRPGDVVTLFNRAIVDEREQLYMQAEADWKQYLATDADQEWRAEARSHLEEIERKLQQQREKSQRPHESLEQAIAVLSSENEGQITEIDAAAESYQEALLREWISELAKGQISDSKRRNSIERALNVLAQDLRVRHQDSWLLDFLSSLHSDSRAIKPLLLSIQASEDGDQESAVQLAISAEAEFRKEYNESGRLRAAFQIIYSSRLAAHAELCHRNAEILLSEVERRDYAWLEIQTQLEAAACAGEISRTDEAIIRSQKALQLARQAKYENLELRAMMFVADAITDINKRLNLLRDGLINFWDKPHEAMRGYSFYAAMDYTSGDELRLWHLDQAVIKEGLRLIEADPDLGLQGLETYRLARAQLATNETSEAKNTMTGASVLFSHVPSSALNVGAAIDVADAFAIGGSYKEALDLLASVEPRLSSLSQDIVSEKFYATKGAALLGLREDFEAQRSLVSALKLAGKRLRSTSDERDRLNWVTALEPVYRSITYLQIHKDMPSAFRWWESFKGGSLTNTVSSEESADSISQWEPNLPSFASWSREGTLLLSYATFPEGTVVWAFDGKQVHGRWLGGQSQGTVSLVHSFAKGCADPRSDGTALLLQGQKLYDLLIKPVRDWLPGHSHLIIETDDFLRSVPFEAIVDEQGTYLADEYDIEYSAGLFYIGMNERSGRIGRQSRALIVGESIADVREGLPALSGALAEANEVASQFKNPVLLIDAEATLSRVVNELPQTEIFHFAGHTIRNRELNGLLLAGPGTNDEMGFLNASHLSSTSLLRARLIVLSACSTADGEEGSVNDRDSLARTALASGVPNVVASRWLADSDATRQWMKSFYGSAVTGESISMAAKEARLMIKANKGWRHPFYWATFSVFV